MSKLTKAQELEELLHVSRLKVAAMSPEEYAAMIEAQSQSYARSLAPCEHGMVDFEQCAQCRAAARSALGEQPEVKG